MVPSHPPSNPHPTLSPTSHSLTYIPPSQLVPPYQPPQLHPTLPTGPLISILSPALSTDQGHPAEVPCCQPGQHLHQHLLWQLEQGNHPAQCSVCNMKGKYFSFSFSKRLLHCGGVCVTLVLKCLSCVSVSATGGFQCLHGVDSLVTQIRQQCRSHGVNSLL